MSDRRVKCHQHINQSKSGKKFLCRTGRNIVFNWMSKGKEENRACLQNANIVQILCEGKVKYKVVLFCPLFVLPGLFLGFLVGSLSSHGIGSQSVWHVLMYLGQKCLRCPLVLIFVIPHFSCGKYYFPPHIQRLSCFILVFCIKICVCHLSLSQKQQLIL